MARIFAVLCLFLVGSFTQICDAQAGGLHASELRCESLVDPIGLDATAPRLSWIVTSGRRGERQTAYRILAASSRDELAKDHGDLWDSGRVESAQTTHVVYAGKAPTARQRFFWKVQSWDRDGMAGPWSDVAAWEMGLLRAADWRAAWIDATPRPLPIQIVKATYRTADGSAAVDVTAKLADMVGQGRTIVAGNDPMGGDPAFGTPKLLEVEYTCRGQQFHIEVPENAVAPLPPKFAPCLREGFAVSKPIVRARLYATALGLYEIWLNGKRVGDQRMAPGWTDYRRRVQYQTFDVTPLLRPGANTLGAIVAPGWFAGRAGNFHARAFYGDAPALLAQLEIEYDDGSVQSVVSGSGWQRCDGPILAADIMDGEDYDARVAIEGWCDAEAVAKGGDAGWTPVETRKETRVLVAQPDQPVRVLAELPAKSVSEPQSGRWVFDLGQNMVGVARIRVQEPADTRLTIRHAEMLNPDGTLYTANLRGAAATDTYVCRGGDAETWDPRFTFHGFRYVEVSGLTTKPDAGTVTGIVIGTDLPPVGTFECSDPRINQLQSNIQWGMRGNMLSIPTDCPQRDERMGWTADTQVFVPTAAYNADIGPFMTKWMRDVRDAQRDDGAYSDVAPVMKGLSYGTPVWGDAGTVVPWAVYLFTGDERILEENIDSMHRWVDWCVEHSTDLIRDRDRGNDYGDWLSIGADTPKDVIGTAYFARAAWIVAESYRVLNRPEEAARYRNLFQKIRAAFVKKYIHDDGVIHGDTQTCYLLGLRFDLVPNELRGQVEGHLLDDLRSKGWRLSTGFVGVSLLLPLLDDIGHADAAYRLLLQDAFPSWLFSVRHGATTIWERWDGWTPAKGMNDPGMNSFNHFALGSCGEWLYGGVAGIRPDPEHAGFSHFFVRPRIDGPLTHARATYRSVHGLIESDWRLDGERLSFAVTVPTNTSATVTLPARQQTPIMESGHPLESVDGIQVLGRTENAVTLSVGSGKYVFGTTAPNFRPGNPIIGGWYADPEVAVFGDKAWIFPTYSAPYDEQTHFDAFSSTDLVRWERHPNVLDASAVKWARRAMWAPSVVEKDRRYYFFFAANDIQKDDELGGIGVAVADRPDGPYADYLGKPLVDAFHNGAQPIDPFVFRDADGADYLIYGGWKHCNIARLKPDYTGFVPFDDGTLFKEIAPDGYVEGPFMLRRDGKYYFMWSEGGWTGPDYSVAYAIADSPLGPFQRIGKILEQDMSVATGAGHHSVLKLPSSDRYYMVYHRRPLAEKDANHRVVCIDELRFDESGRIEPVRITFEGVGPTVVAP